MKLVDRLQIKWMSRALGAVAFFVLCARVLDFGLAKATAGLVHAYSEVARVLFGWLVPLLSKFLTLAWPEDIDELLLFYSLIVTAAIRFAARIPAIAERYEKMSAEELTGPMVMGRAVLFFALFVFVGVNLVTPMEISEHTVSAADVWVAEGIVGSRELIPESAARIMPWISMPFRAAFLLIAFFFVLLFFFFAGSVGGAPRTAAARERAVDVAQGAIFGVGTAVVFGLLAFCAGVLYELLFVIAGFILLLIANTALEA